MELWHIYRFVGFVNKEIKQTGTGSVPMNRCLNDYRAKKNLSEHRIGELHNSAIDRKYTEVDSDQQGIVIKIAPYKGRELLDMHGVGFINEELKQFNPFLSVLIALIAGGFIRLMIEGVIWVLKSVL